MSFLLLTLGHTFGEGSEGPKGSKDSKGFGKGFLSLTAFQAEGCGIALTGDEYYNAAFRRSRPHRVS